jgi:hypothetical protein
MTLLRQHINQHFSVAPKLLPEFSLRLRERSPLLDSFKGTSMGETFLLLSCGAAFLTGLMIAAASLFG